MTSMTPDREPACTGCSARRDFLRQAVVAASAIAGLSVAAPAQLLAALESPAGGRTIRYPLPAADGVSIDSRNEVILCRAAGSVFAFALSCPHQNTALRVMPKNAGFQCPRHKSKYQPNGTFVSGRATRNMDRLQIVREGDVLVVDPAVAFESDTDPAGWAAAKVTLT
ncbi:MAG: ubiquinol-cytochrome c reductase iron-sulfur subunit [Gemmatimonadaceae bacterium]|jgi:nitrite reductase/ring-hydroxylating ferredoxin subunit